MRTSLVVAQTAVMAKAIQPSLPWQVGLVSGSLNFLKLWKCKFVIQGNMSSS